MCYSAMVEDEMSSYIRATGAQIEAEPGTVQKHVEADSDEDCDYQHAGELSIPADIAQGRFATLHDWLRENIYQHGSKFTAAELIQRVTGKPMGTDDYLAYLWGKYQPLYALEGEPAKV